MSYALAFTADARYDFSELDVPIRELVLDELDRAAREEGAFAEPSFARDFVDESSGHAHYVFLHLAFDKVPKTIVILGIHQFARKG